MSTLSVDGTADVPLASSPSCVKGMTLTEDGEVPSWKEAAHRFRARLASSSPHNARFSREWASEQQGRVLALDEKMQQWASSSALLTFTGSPRVPGSDCLLPPTSHLDALTESRPERRAALRDVLEDSGIDQWGAIRVVSSTAAGYAHTHVALVADRPLPNLRPVVDAHIDSCRIATEEAHKPEKAVRIDPEPTEGLAAGKPIGAVGYSLEQSPGMRVMLDNNTISEMAEDRARVGAVLEATGTEAVRVDTHL